MLHVSVLSNVLFPSPYSSLLLYSQLQLKRIIVYISSHAGKNFISQLNEMIITNENEIANK